MGSFACDRADSNRVSNTSLWGGVTEICVPLIFCSPEQISPATPSEICVPPDELAVISVPPHADMCFPDDTVFPTRSRAYHAWELAYRRLYTGESSIARWMTALNNSLKIYSILAFNGSFVMPPDSVSLALWSILCTSSSNACRAVSSSIDISNHEDLCSKIRV